MELHQKAIAEYFKLYVLLNKANRHRDEKTSLEFTFLEAEKETIIFLAYLDGSSENAKIQLAAWSRRESWHSNNYSGLCSLEDHIVDKLLSGHQGIGLKLRRKPNKDHLKSLLKIMHENLRSLGIKK